MSKLKINFVDFWADFQKNNNYFFHLLNTKYDVVIDENDPDLLFFSVDYEKKKERDRYREHRCKKIFYTGENVRPNFNFPGSIEDFKYSIGKCDFAFTFDFLNHPNHFRLPLWIMYVDWFNKGGYKNPQYLIPKNKIDDNQFIRNPKDKFCCMIASNLTTLRIEFFNKLNEYKKCDGFGSIFNNRIPNGEQSKYHVLSNYKFSICFENSISPVNGYYTEKLLHAKTAGTIPIYYSDNLCNLDFNEKSFINLCNFFNIEECIKYIKKVDNDQELYKSILKQPLFKNNKIPEQFLPKNILLFIENML